MEEEYTDEERLLFLELKCKEAQDENNQVMIDYYNALYLYELNKSKDDKIEDEDV